MWPRAYLWSSGRGHRRWLRQSAGTLWNVAGRIVSSTESGMPICATSVAPQWSRPGRSRWPGFRRKKVTVRVARTATPCDRSGPPVDPAREVDGEHRDARWRSAPPRSRAASPESGRSSPAPNSASMTRSAERSCLRPEPSRPDRHSSRPRARRRPSARSRSPKKRDADISPLGAEQRRGDKPVAAVVARPGKDQDLPLLRHVARRVGDRRAGVSHELEARHARLRRRAGRLRPSPSGSEAPVERHFCTID